MSDKHHILNEIKRLTAANSGNPPGWQLFERETGIKKSDWYPYIWLSWGEALVEAGYAPNQLRTRTSDEEIVLKYIGLMRELRGIPVAGQMRRKAKSDKSFPSHTVFDRFGNKEELIAAVVGYCRDHPGFEDILVYVLSISLPQHQPHSPDEQKSQRLQPDSSTS